ncbi:MAG: hypothetical protein MJ244_02450 [Clostridia bacterium]|nr:hypothetical protein [Clostridia bacterium]
MNKFSEWNKIDLHIHSPKSNDVIQNDYLTEEFSCENLLKKLIDNSINIFSITDHNCLNVELYKELNELCVRTNINYIVGSEISIYDTNINERPIHCLCFFDTYDLDKINKTINEMFNNIDLINRNKKENYPDITKAFKCFSENDVRNVLLIPHFNNKHSSIPSSDRAVDYLNQLCFDAYEDANNISQIQKSLKIYLENGYEDFPFVAFSDNHNLKRYPENKEGEIGLSCYILGSIEYPFNSIKTAFQEAKLRISLSKISGVRSIEKPKLYVDSLKLNGEIFNLSPYQNSIIGRFGSGKSLLYTKIVNGNDSLRNSRNYSKLYELDRDFSIKCAGQEFSSLQELKNSISTYKVYETIQHEEYYYKDYLSESEINALLKRLNININFSYATYRTLDKTNFIEKYEKLKEYINKSNANNNINYKLAFKQTDYYSISDIKENKNYELELETIQKAKKYIDNNISLKINGIDIYTQEEKDILSKLLSLINNKSNVISKYVESNLDTSIQRIINDYDCGNDRSHSKEVKDNLLEDFSAFCVALTEFSKQCKLLDEIFTKKDYDSMVNCSTVKIDEVYSISYKYKIDENYKSFTDSEIKNDYKKDNSFSSIINTVMNNEKFIQNKDLNFRLTKYLEDVENSYKHENIQYDILLNNESMLKKSSGQKSSLFIEMIFSLIEKDLENKNNVLLICDQPEDNIDNKNVFIDITNNIKRLKFKYNNFQIIDITHNANVCITSDTENIIIANENRESQYIFEYSSCCIENEKEIEKVCEILEGGKKALQERSSKYGINIIRKVEQNEIHI